MSDINSGFDSTARITPIDALQYRQEGRKKIYDPKDPMIQSWLKDNWELGYNPLAADHVDYSNTMQLSLPNGERYNYSEPSHSYDHYRQNRDGQPPKFLVHITKTGWVEYALKVHDGMIGKEGEVWTGAHDPNRWWGGILPDDFDFTEPPERFVELMFDAEKLRDLGIDGKAVPYTDYYVFKQKLPLHSLVPTSKAYVSQVLGFAMPDNDQQLR